MVSMVMQIFYIYMHDTSMCMYVNDQIWALAEARGQSGLSNMLSAKQKQ